MSSFCSLQGIVLVLVASSFILKSSSSSCHVSQLSDWVLMCSTCVLLAPSTLCISAALPFPSVPDHLVVSVQRPPFLERSLHGRPVLMFLTFEPGFLNVCAAAWLFDLPVINYFLVQPEASDSVILISWWCRGCVPSSQSEVESKQNGMYCSFYTLAEDVQRDPTGSIVLCCSSFV